MQMNSSIIALVQNDWLSDETSNARHTCYNCAKMTGRLTSHMFDNFISYFVFFFSFFLNYHLFSVFSSFSGSIIFLIILK